MLKEMIVTVVRVLALCLLVGLVLAFFDIRPFEIFSHLRRTILEIFDFLSEFVDWAWPYVLRGGEIVVPVAIVMLLMRWRGRPHSR